VITATIIGAAGYLVIVGFVGEFLDQKERGKAWGWPVVVLVGLGAMLGARLKQKQERGG
jgi:F0F1-type ATP synthase assembly protein I